MHFTLSREIRESLRSGSVCQKTQELCSEQESKETQHVLGNSQSPDKAWAYLQLPGHPYAVTAQPLCFRKEHSLLDRSWALHSPHCWRQTLGWGGNAEGSGGGHTCTFNIPQDSGTLFRLRECKCSLTSKDFCRVGLCTLGQSCSELGICGGQGGTAGPY